VDYYQKFADFPNCKLKGNARVRGVVEALMDKNFIRKIGWERVPQGKLLL
jgi:hypothetical protein